MTIIDSTDPRILSAGFTQKDFYLRLTGEFVICSRLWNRYLETESLKTETTLQEENTLAHIVILTCVNGFCCKDATAMWELKY